MIAPSDTQPPLRMHYLDKTLATGLFACVFFLSLRTGAYAYMVAAQDDLPPSFVLLFDLTTCTILTLLVAIAALCAWPCKDPLATRFSRLQQAVRAVFVPLTDTALGAPKRRAPTQHARLELVLCTAITAFVSGLCFFLAFSSLTPVMGQEGPWWLEISHQSGLFLSLAFTTLAFAVGAQPWWNPPTLWLRTLHQEIQDSRSLPR